MDQSEINQGFRDTLIANQNALLTIMDLISRQPHVDPFLLKANLQTAIGTEFCEMHPATQGLLEKLLEIVERSNPGL